MKQEVSPMIDWWTRLPPYDSRVKPQSSWMEWMDAVGISESVGALGKSSQGTFNQHSSALGY